MEIDQDTATYIAYGKSDNVLHFRILFEKYKVKVLNTIILMSGVSKPEAEDILQDVFMKVIEQRKSFRLEAKFSTWLHTLVHNRMLNYLRDRKQTFNIDELELAAVEKTPLDKLIDADQKKYLQQALQSLSHQQRTALVLREYEQKSYEEISQIMQVSVSAVESLLFHARQNLKKIVKGVQT